MLAMLTRLPALLTFCVSLGCANDDESGDGHEDSADHHASESEGSTTGLDDTAAHAETSVDPGDPVAVWCNCMLTNCHDAYHAQFGEEHPTSEEMCQAAGAAVPQNGAPVMTGNFLECRQHFCDQAAASGDMAGCENAIGDAVCI